MQVGGNYALCLDTDGANLARPFTDTGRRVYVSPLTSLNPREVSSQQVRFVVECVNRACANAQAYVARACDGAQLTGSLAEIFGATASGKLIRIVEQLSPAEHNRARVARTERFHVDLSLRTLAPGAYTFCLDADGGLPSKGMGDTGLTVTVRGLV